MSFSVTSQLDTGAPGTLRWAIAQANLNPGSTIFLDVTPIIITDITLNINVPTIIQGNVPNATIVHDPVTSGALFNVTGGRNLAPVQINNVTIQGSASRLTADPGILLDNANFITDTVILTNLRSTTDGGAIFATDSTINLLRTNITLCQSARGAGMSCDDCSIYLAVCKITANGSPACVGGGGIYLEGCNFVIDQTEIAGNTCLTYGGGVALAGSNGRITNSALVENTTTGTVLGLLSGGGGIGVFGTDLVMINCTVANNSSSLTGGGISVSLLDLLIGSLQLVNVTIVANSTNLIDLGGAGIYAVGLTPQVGNCIIAANDAGLIGSLSPDAILLLSDILSPFTTMGGNVIGTTVLGFTNGINNDRVGSFLFPLNPRINGLAYNGGFTRTVSLQAISPAINNGINTNPLIADVPFDQRGTPFIRVNNSTINSGAFEFQSTSICFDGSARILTLDIGTNKISDLPADQVYSNRHLVYDTDNNEFVPIVYNIVSGHNDTFFRIKKHLFKCNKPFDDLFMTAGHPIKINGEEIPADKIVGAKMIKKSRREVYTICTEKRIPILINGIEVMTWSREDWNEYIKNNPITWEDNKPRKD